MGGITASCDGPEDCTTGSCCASFSLAGGGLGGKAACEASCAPSLSPMSGMLQTKLCHQMSDCAGYGANGTDYELCCTYTGAGYYFCAPDIAPLVSPQVTCL